MNANDLSHTLRVPRKDFLILALGYALAHAGILLVLDAVYWDDWTLWNVAPATIQETYRQAGAMFNFTGALHVTLLKAGPWMYRVLTFLIVFASGIFVYHIARRQSWLPARYHLPLALFYLVTPFYAARVALIDFTYTLSLFLFFWAWYLLPRRQLPATLLFLVSFNTQSFLVFYALPILELMRLEVREWSVKPIFSWALRRSYLLLAPFAWFAVKVLWFRPFGDYRGYNEQFGLGNLLRAALGQAGDLVILQVSFAAVVAGVLCAWALSRSLESAQTDPALGRTCLLVSAVALVCGLFPYWILGHTPQFADWNSRHQLLMPLGVAVGLVAAIVLAPVDAKRTILVSVVGLSLAVNWTNYAMLFMDWNKQRSLISFLRHDPLIREANLIVFEDLSQSAFSRKFRFYEYNGLLKAASHSATKFGVNASQVDEYHQGRMDRFFKPRYNAEDHRRMENGRIAKVVLRGGVHPMISVTAGPPVH